MSSLIIRPLNLLGNAVVQKRVVLKSAQSTIASLRPQPERIAVITPPQSVTGVWLDLERYRNGIQPRPNNPLATYSELEKIYQPNSPLKSFAIPSFELSSDDAVIYKGITLSKEIANKYLSKEGATLPVHPQTAKHLTVPHIPEIITRNETKIEVAPTASSRTVFSLESDLPPHCLKLHFPFQITRSKRFLDRRTIEHSIGASNSLLSSNVIKVNRSIAFLPESLGIAYKNQENSWGTLVREMTPYPYINSKRILLPLFSLYSPDIRNPNEPPILKQLIERSNENPADFILNRILFPLLSGWVQVFLETGVVLEAHGQNTCIETDLEGTFKRIVFRDFDTYVNQEIREKRGLSPKGLMLFKNEDTETKPQGSVFSLLYDQAMGVPFNAIATLAEKEFKIPQEFLQEKCRLFLRDIFPEGDLFFPKNGKVYNYDQGILQPGVKTRVLETGQPPKWR